MKKLSLVAALLCSVSTVAVAADCKSRGLDGKCLLFQSTPYVQMPVAPNKPGPIGSCVATYANYLKLTDGMTVEQANATIGCAGEEQNRATYADTVMETYSWHGAGTFGSVTVMFQNGRLTSRSQFGLNEGPQS